jgi:homoserine kinase
VKHQRTIRVPASSANLGPGFDTLGLALGLHLDLTFDCSAPPATPTDEHHLAVRVFRAEGGIGDVSVRAAFAGGRGMGFSGAARVAGATAARLQLGDDLDTARRHALRSAAAAEGHGDNVAASVLGGFTVCAGEHARRIDTTLDASVVLWIPADETSTKASRSRLPESVPFHDAAANIANTALLVAAVTAGDTGALRAACTDRLHQDLRFDRAPRSRAAHRALLATDAWCAWLSGSGPTVAALCRPDDAEAVRAALPSEGRSVVTTIDFEGTREL